MDRKKIMNELEEVVLDINIFLRHELGREFGTEMGKRMMNLSHNQQMVLFLIEHKGINHVKDLARYLNVSPSAVSQIIAKFEQQDVLKRKVEDSNRRSTLIEMGPKGREILDEMNKIRSTVFLKYLSKMEEDDLLVIKSSFSKFYNIIVETKEEHE
ncbi:MarR family transcriptional regulator [Salipaludibacillus sp. HK11]|uniref:MarR family transcriptional regulator n=1 Tax=Salipaludibacillus sp. HK11 TaxID=3394320 RepID=UPI0039FCA380